MLRLALFLLLFKFSFSASAIKCHLQTIEKDFEASTIVFYGKYTGEEKLKFYDYFGDKLIIDNFIIYEIFKGVDTDRLKVIRKYKNQYQISLIRDSFRVFDSYPFIKGNEYLVYTYKNPYTGYLMTEGCRRTREIVNKDFISKRDWDKDYNKNEYDELLKLSQQDSVYHFTRWADELYAREQKLSDENIDLSREIKIWRTGVVILSSTLLLAVIYIIRLKTKKPG